MFAFVKNNEINFISPKKIDTGKKDEKWIEYDDIIMDPILFEGKIIERPEPEPTPEERNRQIGEKILQEVFSGNPYAQIADLTKSQVIMLALLVPIIGKETIRTTFGDLVETLYRVSEARVTQGLTSFDLSFLE